MQALKSLRERFTPSIPEPPFTDFLTFEIYWASRDCKGSFDCRRQLVQEILAPISNELASLSRFRGAQVKANVGSDELKPELAELRVVLDRIIFDLEYASTPTDFSNLGNACVNLLENLAHEAILLAVEVDPSLNLGERGKPVNRFDGFLSTFVPGPKAATVRKIVRELADLAHSIKHNTISDQLSLFLAVHSSSLLFHFVTRVSYSNGIQTEFEEPGPLRG